MAEEKPPVEQYDGKYGKYKDNVSNIPEDEHLPIKEMPQGPDPQPFKLGPKTSGTREGGELP